MRSRDIVYLCAVSAILTSCGTKPIQPSEQHIQRPPAQSSTVESIPQAIKGSVVLPPPKLAGKVETYSVVVTNVSAQEILFALARDAKINLDIHPGITGTVTVNAINQTLPQILTRIAKQVDMRYELDNGTLTVMPDKPYLKTYNIDFINISRSATSTNSTSSQITGGATEASGSSGGNAASTIVKSKTENNLMDSLVKNVLDMILEEDKLKFKAAVELAASHQGNTQGEGQISTDSSLGKSTKNKDGSADISGPSGSASGSGNQTVQSQNATAVKTGVYEAAVNVFANKETGVLIVRATSRQHQKVQEFIDKVMTAAKRQVLIEATIVEVQLSDQYQQGINWSRLLLGQKGFALSLAGTDGFQANPTTNLASTAGALAVSYINPTSKFGDIKASVQLLEKFGNVKVLSSPKLTVMNNQTASLKVANSKVYFTITTTPATYDKFGAITSPATYTTAPQSVSVGLTMSVTPQISDTDSVTINVRPSISSLIGLGAKDPNPALANPCGTGVQNCNIPGIQNLIPEIQTREMESIIKIENGQMAVMGGLIKEEMNKNTSEVPFLGRIPLLGNLFQNRDDTTTKTELVIFLRPIVIKEASINGDFAEFRNNLPDQNFFNESASGKP